MISTSLIVIMLLIGVGYVSFRLGQEDILNRFREYCEKRKKDEDVCAKFNKFDIY